MTTETVRPQARQTTHVKYAKHAFLKDEKGKPVKVTVGRETVRSATCGVHQKPTSAFDGVTSEGWVFVCAGNGSPESRHTFAAEPAS
jgi:hypothetical protein